jgi:hypothetical protein
MAVKSLKRSTIESPAQTYNSANAGYSFQDFHHLETVQLGGSTASVSLSNLDKYAGEYTHLQIRAVGRTDRAGLDRDICIIRFNGDSGNNYQNHSLVGTGSSVISSTGGTISSIEMTGYTTAATATSGRYSTYIIDIIDSYKAKNKVVRIFSNGQERSGESGGPNLASGLWRNTSAITSMTFSSGTGSNWIAGSRFSLYGIR